MVDCVIVSIYKRTVMNGTSPRQIPVHILMSLANKCCCNLILFKRARERERERERQTDRQRQTDR